MECGIDCKHTQSLGNSKESRQSLPCVLLSDVVSKTRLLTLMTCLYNAAMTQTNTSTLTPGALRARDAAQAIGVNITTLCRWATLSDDRGVALRRARIARGWYSVTRLREAGLLT
jgi:hypothetical protein